MRATKGYSDWKNFAVVHMSNTSNFLIGEKSPYLQQHAHNPVKWYPWGDAAFEKARKEDKPVFLSIGYSTCHWCHVMERESFEDEEVAKAMNSTFVSIKVDREERPDLDNLYMNVCQMMTGSGGWPLNLILTPDRKPIFAFTYLPKHSRRNMMGIVELCSSIDELWRTRKDELIDQGKKVLEALSSSNRQKVDNPISPDLLKAAYSDLENAFDPQFGGFGSSPKFPSTHYLLFLLRYYHRYKDNKALVMVEKTINGMLAGGITDQIGHGFHRYSTDHAWKLPHFEKMLYDQALILSSLAELFSVNRNDEYLNAMIETLQFLNEEMKTSDGAFITAIDADSEGQEGKYYTWTMQEIKSTLGEHDAEIFSYVYGIEPDGNFHEESSGRLTSENILFVANSFKEASNTFNIPLGEVQDIIKVSREKLKALRSLRSQPHKDDKVLSDMNGLLLWSLSKCYLSTGEGVFLAEAEGIASFLLDNMIKPDGKIMHRYISGSVDIPGFLDDYAFTIAGLLKLYEATGKERLFKRALKAQEYLDSKFSSAEGGYFTTEMEDAPLKTKDFHDGAIPSGNSFEMQNLLTFSIILGSDMMYENALRIAEAAGKSLQTNPSFYLYMLTAVDFAIGPSYDMVLQDQRLRKDSLKELSHVYEPRVIISYKKDARHDIEEASKDNVESVLVCSMKECLLPQKGVKEALSLIRKMHSDI
jgi:uncharacterized protein YyaL (SSP411 family)